MNASKKTLVALVLSISLLAGCQEQMVATEDVEKTVERQVTMEQAQQVEKPALVATPSTSKLYDEYEAKIAEAAQEVEALGDSFTGYTTVEMNAHMGEIVQVWDQLLNDMYQALKANLHESEFAALQAEQRQWIKERDVYAEKTATEEAEGGTMYTMVYLSAISEYTEQRCYDLLNEYMAER